MLDGDNWWHEMDDCAWSLVERRSATSGHMSNVQCCDSGRHSHGHMSSAPDYWLPPVIMKIFTPWLVILPQLPPTHTQLYPTTLLRTLKMMNLEKCLKNINFQTRGKYIRILQQFCHTWGHESTFFDVRISKYSRPDLIGTVVYYRVKYK